MSTAVERTSIAPPETQRACIVCRGEKTPDALIRLTVDAGVLVACQQASGRSAYVCCAEACVASLAPKHLKRSKLGDVHPESFVDLRGRIVARAMLGISREIGLARRSGQLRLGEKALPAHPGESAVAVVSSRSVRRGYTDAMMLLPVSAETLGSWAGIQSTQVAVVAGSFADRVRHWSKIVEVLHPPAGVEEGNGASGAT